MLINWGPALFVNHPVIDDQHKELVALMNDLTDKIERDRPREEIDKVFKKTLSYTKYHFACEEKLMVKSKHPEHLQHRAQHYSLIESLNNFYAKYYKGEMPTVELMEFLRDWIAKHILTEDVKLSKSAADIKNLDFSFGYASILSNTAADLANAAKEKKE